MQELSLLRFQAKELADVVGEAHCKWCGTIRGNEYECGIFLLHADFRRVASGHHCIGVAARYRRYQPHASVLHH